MDTRAVSVRICEWAFWRPSPRRTPPFFCRRKLKDVLIELGRDFCFVGSEYPVQVGKRDFAIDLLFFHRGLNCLCAIELKVDRFERAHLGQLNFYLEALDRVVRKTHENPSIGVHVPER